MIENHLPAFSTTINHLRRQHFQAGMKKSWYKCLFYKRFMQFFSKTLEKSTYAVNRNFDFFHPSSILQSRPDIFNFGYLLYTLKVTARRFDIYGNHLTADLWGLAPAQLGWVGWASTNKGRFCKGQSMRAATGSPEEKVLPLFRYWLDSRVHFFQCAL